jgi:hypothetical protein
MFLKTAQSFEFIGRKEEGIPWHGAEMRSAGAALTQNTHKRTRTRTHTHTHTRTRARTITRQRNAGCNTPPFVSLSVCSCLFGRPFCSDAAQVRASTQAISSRGLLYCTLSRTHLNSRVRAAAAKHTTPQSILETL